MLIAGGRQEEGGVAQQEEGAGNFRRAPVDGLTCEGVRHGFGQNGISRPRFMSFWHIHIFLLILELILHGIRIQGKGAASGGAPSCLADWDSF